MLFTSVDAAQPFAGRQRRFCSCCHGVDVLLVCVWLEQPGNTTWVIVFYNNIWQSWFSITCNVFSKNNLCPQCSFYSISLWPLVSVCLLSSCFTSVCQQVYAKPKKKRFPWGISCEDPGIYFLSLSLTLWDFILKFSQISQAITWILMKATEQFFSWLRYGVCWVF